MSEEPRNERRETLHLGVLMALPLLAVLVLATVSLYDAYEERETTQLLEEEMSHAETVRHLIHRLQMERSATCLFVSTATTSSEMADLRRTMWKTRVNTSKAWENAMQRGRNHGKEATLIRHRSAIDKGGVQCNTVIEWYHSMIDYFIGSIIEEFGQTSQGQLWRIIQAYTSWIDGKEAMGIKRALGSQFFPRGYFSDKMAKSYHENSGAAEQLFAISEKEFPWVAHQMSLLQTEHMELFVNLSKLENYIDHNNLSKPEPSLGMDWYRFMTIYNNLLATIEQNIAEQLSSTLTSKNSGLFRHFLGVLFISGACLLLCPMMAALYVAHSRRLFAKISKATSALEERTQQLAEEETKTNNLLHQLLPAPIARLLKEGITIPPQSFEAVTILFSDIVEFTALAAQSNPMQVVNLLNAFYVEFDELINAHDCYKVETIGDAFLVASGLPISNGVAHSNEIAMLSLAVREMTHEFVIPHMKQRQLMVRIGIHTGACVAGVIGTSAPKYGLFGDAVNTASRMESTGEAMRIHLTEATFQHLNAHHRDFYELQMRGSCHVKGKGYMTTYWLEGKKSVGSAHARRETQETPLPGECV